jgi:hypothetical protein
MKFARIAFVLLSACLVTGGGCNRKKRGGPTAPQFSAEAMQAVVEAERSTQGSLTLLDETLKNWLLRHPSYPKELQEFVTTGMLPRLPTPPPGKKFVIDPQRKSVVLADQ